MASEKNTYLPAEEHAVIAADAEQRVSNGATTKDADSASYQAKRSGFRPRNP
jgi:hypothetical protein